MKKNLPKSILAIVAGMLLIVVLSVITDMILEKLHVFTPPEQGLFTTWMLTVATIYRCVYGVLGGYLAAVLAPENAMKHAVILGVIGIVANLAGAFVAWNLSSHWYPLVLTLTALPCTWIGGRIAVGNRKTAEA